MQTTAATFAPRASTATKNPAVPGTALCTSFAVVWSADTVAFFAMHAWKLGWLQKNRVGDKCIGLQSDKRCQTLMPGCALQQKMHQSPVRYG
ncbi:hypothetical protein V6N13_004663 [Hibiscus sabdariffa]